MAQVNLQPLIKEGTKIQQQFYEHLPDWYFYKENEHKYLKMMIAFTLSPETFDRNNNLTSSPYTVLDLVEFPAKINIIVEHLFKIIYDHATFDNTKDIYCSVIYNVLILTEESSYIEKDNTASNNNSPFYSCPVPIFKVKKMFDDKSETIWYIDTSGRVYENWEDYKQNNNLPKSYMILPKDARYQADPSCLCTEDQTTVWIELLAPSYNAMDVAKNVLNVTSTIGKTYSVGVGLAALFTPIGPAVAISGIAIGAASGIWNIAQAVVDLKDRSDHKQSLVDGEAAKSWFAIAENVSSIAATGRILIFKRVVNTSEKINNMQKTAFNVTQGLHISSSSAILGLQICGLYRKFKENETITPTDIFLLSLQLMHFGMSIATLKFAEKFIYNSKSNVLHKYEQSLKSERHITEFQKINNSSVNKSMDIIRSVKIIYQTIDLYKHNYNYFSEIKNFINDRIYINSTVLISPILLVVDIAKTVTMMVPNGIKSNIATVIKDEIKKFFLKFDTAIKDYTDYEEIITEIQQLNQPKYIITLLLQASTDFFSGDMTPKDLHLVLKFLWGYCKEALYYIYGEYYKNQMKLNIACKHLSEMVTVVTTSMGKFFKCFAEAFSQFLCKLRDMQYQHLGEQTVEQTLEEQRLGEQILKYLL